LRDRRIRHLHAAFRSSPAVKTAATVKITISKELPEGDRQAQAEDSR